MTKKRLLTAVLILAALVCGGLVVRAMNAPQAEVTKANFDRIKKGMTRTEIENIFNWGKGHWAEVSFGEPGERNAPGEKGGQYAWGGDDGVALVTFDSHGKAIYLQWTDRPRTLLQKLRGLIPF